jgi:hypothetical protein
VFTGTGNGNSNVNFLFYLVDSSNKKPLIQIQCKE